MKIEQEKEFKPLTITLETKEDYDDFFNIIEEANDKRVKVFMSQRAEAMGRELSGFATNNT
jgi:hypothetical protein